MSTTLERQLMRLLHGELEPEVARRLERRLEQESSPRGLYEHLAHTWDSLELPPLSPVPEGFTAGVLEAARRLEEGELSWSLAPRWARAGAAAALISGLVLGTALGGGLADPAAGDDPETVALADPLSLAEGYWLSLEENGGLLSEEGEAEGVR